MRAAVFEGPGVIRVRSVAAPRIVEAADAIVRVVHTCICGSDLWAYRGIASRTHGQRIGHEFVGEVMEVGRSVRALRPGDEVVAPFSWSCGRCPACDDGLQTACTRAGFWGRTPGADGAQAEAVRVPFADATLVVVPRGALRERGRALLTLSDVLCTGHHAARCARTSPGSTVAVVGDGAVGLCAVLAARRLGAERIVLLGRHLARTEVGRAFGATDVVAERGQEAVDATLALTRGRGADAVLECVGSETSLRTAVLIARPGGAVGFVGVPHAIEHVPLGKMFGRNVALVPGIAPVRAYIPELLPEVLAGRLDPSPVFDSELPLEEASAGYAAMDSRRALKVLLTPGQTPIAEASLRTPWRHRHRSSA